MKFLYLILTCIALLSCKKDEVTPQEQQNDPIILPPDPIVELSCHFIGDFGGANLELTQNVLGYSGIAFDSLYINSSPILSGAVYSFAMRSTGAPLAIEIAHGTVLWDYSVSNSPSLAQFNEFHATDTIPGYSTGGMNGFEVIFTDNFGAIWKSSSSSANPQNVSFNTVISESDENGDYAKYICQFNCYVYNAGGTDSIQISNALLEGWFKR